MTNSGNLYALGYRDGEVDFDLLTTLYNESGFNLADIIETLVIENVPLSPGVQALGAVLKVCNLGTVEGVVLHED